MTYDEMVEALFAADAYAKAGRFADAECKAREAVSGYPSASEAHYGLGIVYLESEQLPKAEASFRRAVDLDPEVELYHDYYYRLGISLHKQGKFEEARAALESAVEGDDSDYYYQALLGGTCRKCGDLEAAKIAYFSAVQLAGSSASANFNLGVVCLELRDFEKAEHYLGKALSLNPSDNACRQALEQARSSVRSLRR